MRGMVASPHEQQIPPFRFAPVGMTTKKLLRSGRKDDMRLREVAGRVPSHPRVGMEVSTPVRMPVGQREVTVLRRV